MSETWLPVVGYEGWYDVSDLGRVRRIRPGRGACVGRILHTYRRKDGYCDVGLLKGAGTRQVRLVHALVCRAFNGEPPSPKHQVNHKDGVKHNNIKSNLEWVTRSEDCRHKHDVLKKGIGLAHPLWGKVGPEAPMSKRYIMTSPGGEEIHIIGLAEFCRQHGLSNLDKVLSGKLKHVRGWTCRRDE